jgi:hypothetical protein
MDRIRLPLVRPFYPLHRWYLHVGLSYPPLYISLRKTLPWFGLHVNNPKQESWLVKFNNQNQEGGGDVLYSYQWHDVVTYFATKQISYQFSLQKSNRRTSELLMSQHHVAITAHLEAEQFRSDKTFQFYS